MILCTCKIPAPAAYASRLTSVIFLPQFSCQKRHCAKRDIAMTFFNVIRTPGGSTAVSANAVQTEPHTSCQEPSCVSKGLVNCCVHKSLVQIRERLRKKARSDTCEPFVFFAMKPRTLTRNPTRLPSLCLASRKCYRQSWQLVAHQVPVSRRSDRFGRQQVRLQTRT